MYIVHLPYRNAVLSDRAVINIWPGNRAGGIEEGEKEEEGCEEICLSFSIT
jgi:hypothetical protein